MPRSGRSVRASHATMPNCGRARPRSGDERYLMMTYEFDLGSYSRPITTSSPEAQIWFDRGLLWTYGFNHEEAVFCFKQAAEADPECAMANWGIAYALGPNYNKPWEAFDESETSKTLSEAHHSTMRAAALAGRCTQMEKGLIEALQQRYQSADMPPNLAAWVDDFAAAMRAVYPGPPRRCGYLGSICGSGDEPHPLGTLGSGIRQGCSGR